MQDGQERPQVVLWNGEAQVYTDAEVLSCAAGALWSRGVLLYPEPAIRAPAGSLRLVLKLAEIGKQVVVDGVVRQELEHGGRHAWRVDLVEPPAAVVELLARFVASRATAEARPRQAAVTGPTQPVAAGAAVTVDESGVATYDISGATAPIVERQAAAPAPPRTASPRSPQPAPSPRRAPSGFERPLPQPAATARPVAAPRAKLPEALRVKAEDELADVDEHDDKVRRPGKNIEEDAEQFSRSANKLQDLFRAALKDVE